MQYAWKGPVEFHRAYVVARMVEIIDESDADYSAFFMSCIASGDSDRMYWGIEGYVKTAGDSACSHLVPFIFKNGFPLACKANIIVQLSRTTNNTFEQGKPVDAGFWKESDIDYDAIRRWAEQGFPRGNGYEEPVRHACLDSPETAAEKVYSKIDKKLKLKREKTQDLAHPTNWLVQADMSHMDQIRQRWDLPAYYIDFLSKASPLNANLRLKEYGRITVYGAHNLIEAQNGYCYNPVTQKEIDCWNKNYLIIADRNANPFCIDLSLEKSPVYYALHGMGNWEFSEAFEDFMRFLKQII